MLSADIDDVIAAEIEPQGPGAAVAVVKDGSPVYCKGHGLANLEWNISIAPDTVFRLASVSKQFTAAAILLLEARGQLRIEDSITTYLPDYPTQGRTITIAHLLHHTSGIKSYTDMEGFLEQWSKLDLTDDELVARFKDVPLEFEPGTQFKYNNSGYHLLGRIIEAVSGTSYADYMRAQIFQPLGMMHSYYMSNEAIIPHRAEGYQKTKDGLQHAGYLNMMIPYAEGGLGSTVEDLIRWDAALREYRLLDKAMQERMYTPALLADGEATDYGYGWSITDYHGHRVASHGGGIHGFSTYIARFLDDATTVIILSNLPTIDVEKLTRRISSLALDIPTASRTPATVAIDELRKVAGSYDAGGFPMQVALDGEELTLLVGRVYHLLPINASAFYAAEDEEFEVRFEDEDEPGQRFRHITLGTPFFSLTAARVSDENGA